ncbi:27375_t:CDS:1, partial [Gigaspora margarita]
KSKEMVCAISDRKATKFLEVWLTAKFQTQEYTRKLKNEVGAFI